MSGIAAIVIEHHPNAVPDDVKGAIASTATAMPKAGIAAGEVNLTAALTAQADPAWEQHWKTALPWLHMPWDGEEWSATRWSDVGWDATRWSATRWSTDSWGDLEP
jgi:hypothetical protein